jgi:uncharacterized protein involved in exopolysaccharide biosynthesis
MKPKLILGLALLIGGLALCLVGLWLLFSPLQYAATARVEMENDELDSSGNISYDPYFIQTSFEVIQSQLVLSNVVAGLNLNVVWGRKHSNGKPLKYVECYVILKNHLQETLVRNTRQIDITYYSSDPKEAVDVANAIAKAYNEYRIQSRKELAARGLQALQQQYANEEKQILILQTNVEQLHQKFSIQDGASNNHLPDQQPYWEAKKQLDRLTDFHKLLASKIEAGKKLDVKMPKTMMVQIVALAEPPQSPVNPDRPLGAALLAVGLFPLLGGILLLKSKS